MDEILQFWKLEKYISFHEAACLIIGKEPSYIDELQYAECIEGLSNYQKVCDKLINDFRTYWEEPIEQEWCKDKELFSYPSYTEFKLGFEDIDEILEINYSLKVKQTAIKEWLGLNNITSIYFDSFGVENSQPSKAKILKMTEVKRKDDVYLAMSFHIKEFESVNNRTPTYQELWEVLKLASIEKWGLKFSNNEIHNEAEKATDYEAFRRRYKRYYPIGNK